MPGAVVHHEYELLDKTQLKPKQFVIVEGKKFDYLKINTGNQDIVFSLPKQTDRTYNISGNEFKNAYPVAVHYKGAVCKEGNFRGVKGSLQTKPTEEGLKVVLDMKSVKYPHGVKTETDLKKLLKVNSLDTCEWTYKAVMQVFNGESDMKVKPQ